MNVQLKLFAAARQLVDQNVVELSLRDGATVADLRQALATECPQLADFVKHVVFAVNSEYADDGTEIPAGAEVACIPPVSGG